MLIKELLFFILFTGCYFSVVAQPVVTSKNFPSAGTAVKNYSGFSSEEIENKSGAGQTWDFSSVPVTFINEVSYVNSNKTNFSTAFSKANLAFEISDGETSDFTYFDINENHIKYLGFAANSSEVPVVAKYNQPWLLYSFPLNFNDAFYNQFSVNHTVIANGETINVFLKADYSYLVDGYGTLITPFGTFPNSLRIYSVTNGRDSSIHAGTLDSTILNSYTTIKVSWISADNGDVGELMSTSDFKNFYFQEVSKSTDIQSNLSSENIINVYPDPASEFINVELSEIQPGQISINVYDYLGNLVKSDRVNNFSAKDLKWQMPVSDIPSGFYIVKIESGTRVWNSKFIRQ